MRIPGTANAADAYALARALHFAIAAIRRAARKTSLKGHSRRVIRLYVTRSPPLAHPAQCYGNVWNFRQRGNSVFVCTRVRDATMEFLSVERAQEELLLVLFRSIDGYQRACWKHAFNCITRVLPPEKNIVAPYWTVKDYIIIVLRVSRVNACDTQSNLRVMQMYA